MKSTMVLAANQPRSGTNLRSFYRKPRIYQQLIGACSPVNMAAQTSARAGSKCETGWDAGLTTPYYKRLEDQRSQRLLYGIENGRFLIKFDRLVSPRPFSSSHKR